jgi:hypothetical protein
MHEPSLIEQLIVALIVGSAVGWVIYTTWQTIRSATGGCGSGCGACGGARTSYASTRGPSGQHSTRSGASVSLTVRGESLR